MTERLLRENCTDVCMVRGHKLAAHHTNVCKFSQLFARFEGDVSLSNLAIFNYQGALSSGVDGFFLTCP